MEEGMSLWKKIVLTLAVISSLVAVAWKFDAVNLAGNFGRDFDREFRSAEREFDERDFMPQRRISDEGAYTLAEQAAILQPDGIHVTRGSPPQYIVSVLNAVNISQVKPTQLSEFHLCGTGKGITTISKIAIDLHGQGEFLVSAMIDGEKVWNTDAHFASPLDFSDGYDVADKYSFAINGSFPVASPKCRKLSLSVTSIKPESKWIIPLVKQVIADNPTYFIDNPGSTAAKYTDIAQYKKLTTYGYGSVLTIYPDGPIAIQAGSDPVQETYQKIMTEKIVVTRTSEELIHIPKKDISAISPNKPLILSTFSVCVQGETPATLKGIALRMAGNTDFTFYASFGPKLLWNDAIKDYENFSPGDNLNSYFPKTFDFIADTPIVLAPDSCTQLAVFSSKVNPNQAKFILPMIQNINSNLQVEYQESMKGKLITTVLGGANEVRGIGSMVLLHDEVGPAYVVNQNKMKTFTSSHATSAWANFGIVQNIGLPVTIKSATFVLQSNTELVLDPDINSYQYEIWRQDHIYANKNNISLQSSGTKKISVPTNKPFIVPINAVLKPQTRMNLSLHLFIPDISATYIPRLVSLETSDGKVLTFPNSNMDYSLEISGAGNTFTGMNGDTFIVTLPGEKQPGSVKMWDDGSKNENKQILPDTPPECPYEDKTKCCKENKSMCKKPDGSSYTSADLKGAKTPQETKYIASILYALDADFNTLAYNHTNSQAKETISKTGGLALAELFLQAFDKNSTTTYVPKKINLTITSDNGAPEMKFLIANKPYVVKSGVPFDIILDPIAPNSGYSSIINFALTEYPAAKKDSFYVKITINTLQYANSSDAVKIVPIVTDTDSFGKHVIATFPWSSETTFSPGGLFVSKDNNIGPPFKKIVDMATMTPQKELIMNQFCLTAKENVTIKTFTFDHIVRDTSPFGSILLDTGLNTTGYLMKNGWSKHLATFEFSSKMNMFGGWKSCFTLKVKGPVAEELEGAYFDLISVDAVNAAGQPIDVIGKNGKALSPDNPVKGTQFDFL